MIRLKNTLREMRTYEIPTNAGAGFVRQKVAGVRRHLVTAGEGDPSGSVSVRRETRETTRMLPISVTLCAANTEGDTSGPLPERVQHVEPFASAITKGHLRVLPYVEPAPVAADPPDPDKAGATSPPSPAAKSPKNPAGTPPDEAGSTTEPITLSPKKRGQ